MKNYREKIDKIELYAPEKQERGTWVLKLKEPVVFKTPSLKYSENSISFNSETKIEFLEFISQLEECVVAELLANSKEFFNGKQFSAEKLKSSLKSSWETKSGIVFYEHKSSEEIKFLDFFGEVTQKDKLTKNVTCVISLEQLIFSKNEFSLDFKIVSMKSRKAVAEKSDWFQQQPQEEEVLEEVPQEVQQEIQDQNVNDDLQDFFLPE